MDATERAIAIRNGGPRPMTAGQLRRKEADMATHAKKTTARKATTAKKRTPKTEATKGTRTANVGKTCSVKGCSHDATRRGMCSGKNRDGSKAAGHYRSWLKEQRAS